MPRRQDEVGAPKIARQKGWMPRIDLLEASNHFLVRAELAGVFANRIHLAYNGDRHSLTIRGERTDDLANVPQRYEPHLLEIEEGGFSREITLPAVDVDLNGVKTQLKNGILTIMIPKVPSDTTVFVVEKVTVKKN